MSDVSMIDENNSHTVGTYVTSQSGVQKPADAGLRFHEYKREFDSINGLVTAATILVSHPAEHVLAFLEEQLFCAACDIRWHVQLFTLSDAVCLWHRQE
jgi:hypothetical protein